MSGMSHKRANKSQGESSTSRLDVVRFASPEQRAAYRTFEDREHIVHRWYDADVARNLHMHEAMMAAFDRLGGATLLTMNKPAYKALTCELMSSLKSDITSLVERGTISFRLGNKDRLMTLEEWNQAFGFTTLSQRSRLVNRFLIKKRFWNRISGVAEYPKTHPTISRIASPLFRYILRVLSHTIYARKEKSKPTIRELLMLFHCLITYQKTGDLWVGGMIAHLADHFGIDFDLYTAKQPIMIDADYLLSAKICGYSHRLEDDALNFRGYEVLLSPEKMDVRLWANWYRVWAGRPLPAEFLAGASGEELKPIADGYSDELADVRTDTEGLAGTEGQSDEDDE